MASDTTDHPLIVTFPNLKKAVECQAFMEAIADDFYLNQVEPYLTIHDITGNIEASWIALAEVLPEVTMFIAEPPGETAAEIYKVEITKAAILLAAISFGIGVPVMEFHPNFGGDTFLEISVDGMPNPIRYGTISQVAWKVAPATQKTFLQWLRIGMVDTLAKKLFPVLGLSDYPSEFAVWKRLEALRAFDSSNRGGITLTNTGLHIPPFGYAQRYSKRDLDPYGVSWTTAAVISAPFAAPELRGLRCESGKVVPAPTELLNWALSRNC